MGIADVRRAFQDAIGNKGTVTNARMAYVKGEESGQRFMFDVALPSGKNVSVEADLPHGVDPNERARQIGKLYGETLTDPSVPKQTKIERAESGRLQIRKPL